MPSITEPILAATDEIRSQIQSGVLDWSAKFGRAYPWREKERTPFEVLIAEVLLKRTTATAAARVYGDFLQQFPSLQTINDTSEKELAQALSQVGLQWQRAKSIKSLASYLVEEQEGVVPCDLHQLLAVPGIGEYSGRAILSFGFDIPVAVVDANVERILARVFQNILPRKPSQRLFQEVADSLVKYGAQKRYNLGLLDLGALVCRYIDPVCEECPLASICDYYNRNKGRLIKERPGRYETAIGIKLRKMREEKGIGLARLAQLSGVSKLTIIRIESGKTSPKLKTLSKLAAVLQVEADRLQ